MASELPDALEKLALKAEQSESNNSVSETSLSKYFGQANYEDDIFDSIAKPAHSEANEEPKVNFFKAPVATPVKEDVSRSSSFSKTPPTFAFKKGDDEEPKIFSYFSQAETSKASEATEFFDQISELTSKTHVPLEISNHPVEPPPPELARPTFQPVSDSAVQQSLPLLNPPVVSVLPTPAQSLVHPPSLHPDVPPQQLGSLSPLPAFAPQIASIPAAAISAGDPSPESQWSKAQERASGWWIPNEKTKRFFRQPGTLIPINELVIPALSSNVELLTQTDPVKQLMRHFDGEAAAASRQTLTADLVTQDDQGIRNLVKAGAWRAAANLCGRLLTAYGQGYEKTGQPVKHTQHSLQLWFTRLALLVKCRLTEMAYNEVLAFGDLDRPELYYEYYPELGKRGTMVPFSFRLLAAELPAHHHLITRAQSQLCQLLATVRRILANTEQFATAEGMTAEERREAFELWSKRENRVIAALVNCALMKKDFHNAAQLLQRQLERTGPTAPNPALYSTLGRIYLQLGDVQRAQKAFNSAADLRNNGSSTGTVASLVDAGLMSVAQNAFIEAHGYFKQALLIEPDNPMLINNTAVCLLYMGSMREAMLMLEESLGTRPDATIRDETVLNVCTLYELESSLTTQRKLGMLRLASQWRNDNLNVASFKLQV